LITTSNTEPKRNVSETVPAVVLLVIVLEVRCNLFEVSYPCDPHQS
jgi:hypothetical protein